MKGGQRTKKRGEKGKGCSMWKEKESDRLRGAAMNPKSGYKKRGTPEKKKGRRKKACTRSERKKRGGNGRRANLDLPACVGEARDTKERKKKKKRAPPTQKKRAAQF